MSKRFWVSLFLLVVSFVTVLGFVIGMQSDGVVPAEMNRDFEAAVHSDIVAEEYAVSRQDNGQVPISARYQAPNRQQQFRTYFMDDGIMMMPRDTQANVWTWGLQLVAAGDIEVEGETAVLTADHDRITYDRGQFSEWYHNSERGLEQGFTILTPLSDNPMLHIDLAVTGNLHPVMSEDGSTITFVSPQGGTILRYSDLIAFDADGETLTAAMSLVELADAQQAVRLSVDTLAAAYPITIDPLTSSDAQWRPYINQDGNFGFSVRDAGDVNGDGYDDVIVGANWFDGGQNNEGAAFLYYGSAKGLSQVFGWKAESNAALAEMGFAVSTAGDVNNDFYDDLIIGAPGYNGTGAAFIFLGGPGGPAASPNIVLNGEQAASRFGFAVSTAGYVNNDSFADVIVGAPKYDGQWGADEGRAYVYYGNSAGVNLSPNWIAETDEELSSPGALFGHSVDTAGDFDRNGFDDVVIGAPYFDSDGETGLVAVFPGSAAGLPGPIATLIDGFEDEADFGPSELGYAVAGAGDVNGDGYEDVIAGAPVYDDDFQTPGFEGAAYLYLGAADRFSGSFSSYDVRLLPSQLDSRFGHAVDGAGDVNRDGYDDLIIGAPQYDDAVADVGAAFLYLGNPDFFWSGFDVGYFGEQSGSVFGTAVSASGDANGDGYDDFVVGAPKQVTPISSVGQAFGFYGYGAISGLTAVNSSPALKNAAVQFEAAISAGGYVNYDWDFGDGNVGIGAKPIHAYSLPGLYNAVVKASNPLSVMTTTTVVSVTVESLITPENGGALTFTNDQGQGTTVNVPPGAVSNVLSLSYTPLNEEDLTQPKPTTSIRYYFDLGPETPQQIFLPIVMNSTGGNLVLDSGESGSEEVVTAVVAACPAGHLCFLKPVPITIFYNEDLLPVGAVENQLKLTFWDEASSKWVDAATTCDPTSTYHYFPAQDFFTVEVCHLSRFGVIH